MKQVNHLTKTIKNKQNTKFVIRVLIGVLILIISTKLWFTEASSFFKLSPKDEYLLTILGINTEGKVIKIEKNEEYEEGKEYGNIKSYEYFTYIYIFKSQNGFNHIDTGYTTNYSKILEVDSFKTYNVKVKYLPSNPKINIVIDLDGNPSLYLLFYNRILQYLITLFIYLYFFIKLINLWQIKYLNYSIIKDNFINILTKACIVICIMLIILKLF